MRTILIFTVSLFLAAPVSWLRANPPAPATTAKPSWSSTTFEAASTAENKKALLEAVPITLTGEVVDVSCFLQMGKRGPKHKECGQKCVRAGQPVGIVDDKSHLTLLMPEQHHPRRDGKASLADWGVEKMAETVTVSGMLVRAAGHDAMYIEVPATAAAK